MTNRSESGRGAVGKTALITGASSGIGEALAHRFAQADFNLVLVARNENKLNALATNLGQRYGVAVQVFACDLARANAATRLLAALQQKAAAIDVLVNCAGVLEHGSFTNIPLPKHKQIIDLNISGLTAMLAAFLPGMLAQGGGRVLNVASIGAFQPVPLLASYAASKAYVLSLSESLSEELKGSGVTVTALCPGITATGMLDKATDANGKLRRIPGFLMGDVNAVAAQGFDACMRGDAICVPGVINQAATVASRGMPKWLVRRIGGLLGRTAF
jgi:uncharacterized protein